MRTQPDRDARQLQYVSQFPLLVGVDTAKQKFTAVARTPDGVFSTPVDVSLGRAQWLGWLQDLHALYPALRPDQVLMGLEFAGHHGATLAHFLRAHGYPVVAIPAKSAKQTRDASLAGKSKTDRADAKHICTALSRGTYVRFPDLQSPIAELKVLVMAHHRLTVERARLKNRLQGILDLVWPEVGIGANLEKVTLPAVLRRWPLPQDILAASPRTVIAFVQAVSRGHHGAPWTRRLLRSAQETLGLPGAAVERRLELTDLLARQELLDTQLAELDRRIEALVKMCPAAKLLDSVPEVGPVAAATIVAELGDPAAFEHPDQWLKLAGLHLADRQSGKSQGRKRIAKQGRPLMRRQLFLLAGRWVTPRGLYRQDYLAFTARKWARTKIVCTLARRLVPILFAVVKSGKPFDKALFLANRRQPEVRPVPKPQAVARAARSAARTEAK
jgi:transposase